MSTVHKAATVSTGEDRKPDVILDYNKTKGGVDCLDQMVAAYTCKRKSNRWPMVVFSNMLDVSALNAFVLWSGINPAWNAGKTFRRRIFLEELGKALVSPLIQRRKSVPRGAASLRMLNQIRGQPSSESIPSTSTATPPTKRKRCHVCTSNRKKTSTVCPKCREYICKEHSVTITTCHKCM
ncbi:piggyBac transposable element-derived protein 4-like [Onychostoma macrolepis]|uniref:piggyBac transposable element-derived protein 4-like n=1 Tax=Onychostoma macrolepis TaxID=369639 RepID=UPI00272B4614|nr:piggyBac transposable element-derived protein 4-like [Onychostoma macrolepis]